jgi:O-antigen/teichoic acid export membrane protein
MARFDRKRVARGAASSVAGLTVRMMLQLLQVPILYLGWDVKQASAWLVLWTLPSYMSLTVSSFSTAGGNLAIEAKREGDVDGVRAAYRATFIAIVISNLLMVIGVGGAFSLLVDDTQWGVPHSSIIWTIAWLGVYCVIRVQSATQDLAYRYGEDYGGYGLYESAATVLELVTMAAVVSLTRNIVILPAALAAVRLGLYVLLSIKARARWPEVFGAADPVLVRAMLRRLFVPFLGFIAMPLLFSINIQGYTLLISNYYGPVVFATFLTMRTLARLVDQLCGTTNRMLFFELSYLDYQKDRDTVMGLTGAAVFVLMSLCGLYIGALLVVGQPLHALWTGGKIAYSVPILLAFGMAGMMRAASDSIFNMLASRNAHVPMTLFYLAGSVLALGVALILARQGAEVYWVAGAVNIAEAVCVVAGLMASARLFKTSLGGFVMALASHGPAALARVPQILLKKKA